VSPAAPPSPLLPATPTAGVAALSARLDELLPQTQCTRCGYPDCRSYADALAAGAAELDQCPPGGAEGVRRLAAALGRPPRPLNPANGLEAPRTLAYIEEAACIGCTLCIQACPVDAIIGAPKRMHAVIEADCTGCELCVPACPVDCIALANASGDATGWAAWSPAQADAARDRYARRAERLAREAREQAEQQPEPADPKRAAIEAALARARQRAKMRPE